ncbi:hypothetical protein [Clostridium sp. 1001283B150210_160208_E6]|uniref:hypothetical protein n=1 Tax=Clostridium sp. 1001283B150210_160208_E6 TaxID=2787129 RepID=UPI0018A92A3E|nr:hypothetical protein [Clostridium sp. 1001283B150210_160208_E6]
MCQCVNVTFGDHTNTVRLKTPQIYKDRFPKKQSEYTFMDKCIADEVQYLWSLGIVTMASCCGHNKSDGDIAVCDEFIPKMKELGYEVMFNPCYPDDEWLFKSKSCVLEKPKEC